MLDLYLLVTPLFAFLSLLTLLNLKLTLAEPQFKDLSKYQRKTQKKQTDEKQKGINHQKTAQQLPQIWYKTALKYLLMNHTIADFCFVRRSRNKICLLFSFSLQALMALIITTSYIYLFSFLGFVITLFYVLLKMIFETKNQDTNVNLSEIEFKKAKTPTKYGKKLEIVFTFLNLLINLAILWIIYRNTKNQQILLSAQNFFIIVSVDNIILKPILLSFSAFFLKFWSLSKIFIEKDIQIADILQRERVLIKRSDAKKQITKVQNSTSNTQNMLEIQPCVNFDIHGNNLDHSNVQNNKELSKGTFLSKKSSNKLQQSESSLIKYINYPFKNIDSNSVGTKICNLRKIELENSIFDKSSFSKKKAVQKSSITRRRNKLYNQKIGQISKSIFEGSKYPTYVQNEEQIDHVDHNSHQINQNQGFFHSAKKSSTSRPNQTGKVEPEFQIFYANAKGITSYQSNEKVGQNLEEDKFNNSCLSGFNYTPKNDLLKISEEKLGQDLEEIDMNSPEIRTNQLRKIQINTNQDRKMSLHQNDQKLKFEIRKVYKKFSLDPNKQILSKQNRFENSINHDFKNNNAGDIIENEQKVNLSEFSNIRKTTHRASEMDLSRKSDIFGRFSNDSRMTKSLKRAKNTKDPIVRQNDQNKIPQFVIQDFTY